jgi:peptide-methionine (S)-S-oxide reductase
MLGIGQGILGIGAFKQRLPRPEEALPGRDHRCRCTATSTS